MAATLIDGMFVGSVIAIDKPKFPRFIVVTGNNTWRVYERIGDTNEYKQE